MGIYSDRLEERFIELWDRLDAQRRDVSAESDIAIVYYIALSKLIELGEKTDVVRLLRAQTPCPPEFLFILGDIVSECSDKKMDDGRTPVTTFAGKAWLYFEMKAERANFPSLTAMYEGFAQKYCDPQTGQPTQSFFRGIWEKFEQDPWISSRPVIVRNTP